QIYKQGSNQIVIQLPGVKDPQAAAQIIGTTAQLELYDLETSLVGPSMSVLGFPVEHTSLYDLLAQVQSQVKDGKSDAWYVVNTKTKRVVSGPFATRAEAEKRASGKPNRDVFAVPDGMVVVTCGSSNPKAAKAVVCPGGQNGSGASPDRTNYYLFKY